MKAKPQAENSDELNLAISSRNNAAHYCKARHKFITDAFFKVWKDYSTV